MDFVEVYATTTGFKQRVPREWLDHPILGRNIKLTPGQRELDGAAEAARVEAEEAAAAAAEEAEDAGEPDALTEAPLPTVERPTEEWTAERIKAFAEGADIDLTGHKASKADMVAAINEVLDAPTDPDPNQGDDETTATVDEEN